MVDSLSSKGVFCLLLQRQYIAVKSQKVKLMLGWGYFMLHIRRQKLKKSRDVGIRVTAGMRASTPLSQRFSEADE